MQRIQKRERNFLDKLKFAVYYFDTLDEGKPKLQYLLIISMDEVETKLVDVQKCDRQETSAEGGSYNYCAVRSPTSQV